MTDVLQTLLDEGTKAQLEYTLTWLSPACFSLGKKPPNTSYYFWQKNSFAKIWNVIWRNLRKGVLFSVIKNTYPSLWSLLDSIISNL